MMLTFRRAEVNDVPVLRELARRIWWQVYPAIISGEQIEYMLEWMYSPEVIEGELGAGVRWELALFEWKPVGFLALGSGKREERVKLHKLYLDGELHGRSFGQAMIGRAKELARELGARELSLQVNKRNTRALRAYERAGFRVEEEGVFDIGRGYVMDDYVMVLGL